MADSRNKYWPIVERQRWTEAEGRIAIGGWRRSGQSLDVFSQKSGISTDHSRSWDISQGHEVARTNPRDRASARLDDKLVKITAPRDIAVQLLLPGYAVVGCDDVQVDHASGSPVLGDVRDFVCRHPFSGDKPLLRV